MKKHFIVSFSINVVLVVATIVLGVLLFRSCNQPTPPPIIVSDTITVTEFKDRVRYVTNYDTIVTYKRSNKYTRDSIIVNHYDTINHIYQSKDTIVDTIRLSIPIEHKESSFNITKDSFKLNGNIKYSGFKAQIDTVDFDYELKYTPPKQSNWSVGWTFSIGPSIGYGITLKPDGTYVPGPYFGINGTIGIGITKKFTRSK